jgi:hypothetical protein
VEKRDILIRNVIKLQEERIKIFRTNKIYFLRRLDNRAPFLQKKQMQEEIILERLTIKHAGVLCVTHLII